MLFPRSYDTLVKLIKQDLMNNTPITNFSESSTAGALVESIAYRLTELYNSLDAVYKSGYLSTATGDSLDYIGELHGVIRHQSTRAYSGNNNFRFYADPSLGMTVSELIALANVSLTSPIYQIKINAGTEVSTSGGIVYVTNSDVVLSDSSTYVNIVANGTGNGYNVPSNTINKHNIANNQIELYTIAQYILCTNDESIETGYEYESDEDYRARIYRTRNANACANDDAILNAAMSVPGVADVIINKYSDGIGSLDLIIITTSPLPQTAILNAVTEAVKKVCACGISVRVTTAEYLSISLKLRLIFNAGVSIERQDTIRRMVRTPIIDYTNNIPVGGEWIVNEVIQRVMQVSDDIKDLEPINFRVNRYYPEMVVVDGKGTTINEVNSLTNMTGASLMWANQKASMNPPQKFLMLGNRLIIC